MTEKKLQPHIKLQEVDRVCFLAGNPDRIPVIASFLKDPQKVADHRGLVAFKGVTPEKEIPVTVLTTGMGCPSTAIVIEEAHKAGGRIFIRIGSTGSLLPGESHVIGSIYIPVAAIRDDGASSKLAPPEVPAVASPEIYQALCQAATNLEFTYNNGLVWTSDIYYNEDPNTFQKWVKYGATCVEMESSLLFTVGLIKGFKIGTILTSDGNLNSSDTIYTGSVEENEKKFEAGVVATIKCAISAVELLK
ncbi:MAG: nucleoside phosphorylase [Candidatus Hodarchaeales archaeon]|jgi:uridine phosphorylase